MAITLVYSNGSVGNERRYVSDYLPRPRTGDVGAAPHFPLLTYTSDLKNGNVEATLPGAQPYRLSARTGWPSVSILRLATRGVMVSTSAFLACP